MDMRNLLLAKPDDPIWAEPIVQFEDMISRAIAHARKYPKQWVCITRLDSYGEAQCFANGPWPVSVQYIRTIVPDYTGYWLLYVKYVPKKESSFDPDDLDDDVKKLCDIIATGSESNGYKINDRYTKAWVDAARHCLERAEEVGKDAESVFTLAKWALVHHFWAANIRSTTKFYKQYDRLREEANKEAQGPAWKQRRAEIEKLWDGKSITSATSSLWDEED